MQKGTITAIGPTQEGGYQCQGGYVYTYIMSIQTTTDLFTGEIGSKSQPYPLAVGSEIHFTVSTGRRGPKIKKVNPQYAQQGTQAGNYPQDPIQRPAAPQAPRRDFDKEARGKCRFGFYQALLHSMSANDLVSNNTELAAVERLVEYSMNGFSAQPPTFKQFAEQADADDFPPSPDDY